VDSVIYEHDVPMKLSRAERPTQRVSDGCPVPGLARRFDDSHR
jgi:hypothetical protein